MTRWTGALAVGFGLTCFGAVASADVPPPDSCNGAGQSCDNAGPEYKDRGTCAAAKCSRATPDGSVEYDCFRCVAGGSSKSGSGDGGCSLRAATSKGASAGAGLAGLMLLGGLGILALERRRPR